VRADTAVGVAEAVAVEAGGAPPEERKAAPVADAEPEPPDPDEDDLAATLSLVSEACAAIGDRLDALKTARAQTDALLEKLAGATIQ
jgi:hypothetical protein